VGVRADRSDDALRSDVQVLDESYLHRKAMKRAECQTAERSQRWVAEVPARARSSGLATLRMATVMPNSSVATSLGRLGVLLMPCDGVADSARMIEPTSHVRHGPTRTAPTQQSGRISTVAHLLTCLAGLLGASGAVYLLWASWQPCDGIRIEFRPIVAGITAAAAAIGWLLVEALLVATSVRRGRLRVSRIARLAGLAEVAVACLVCLWSGWVQTDYAVRAGTTWLIPLSLALCACGTSAALHVAVQAYRQRQMVRAVTPAHTRYRWRRLNWQIATPAAMAVCAALAVAALGVNWMASTTPHVACESPRELSMPPCRGLLVALEPSWTSPARPAPRSLPTEHPPEVRAPVDARNLQIVLWDKVTDSMAKDSAAAASFVWGGPGSADEADATACLRELRHQLLNGVDIGDVRRHQVSVEVWDGGIAGLSPAHADVEALKDVATMVATLDRDGKKATLEAAVAGLRAFAGREETATDQFDVRAWALTVLGAFVTTAKGGPTYPSGVPGLLVEPPSSKGLMQATLDRGSGRTLQVALAPKHAEVGAHVPPELAPMYVKDTERFSLAEANWLRQQNEEALAYAEAGPRAVFAVAPVQPDQPLAEVVLAPYSVLTVDTALVPREPVQVDCSASSEPIADVLLMAPCGPQPKPKTPDVRLDDTGAGPPPDGADAVVQKAECNLPRLPVLSFPDGEPGASFVRHWNAEGCYSLPVSCKQGSKLLLASVGYFDQWLRFDGSAATASPLGVAFDLTRVRIGLDGSFEVVTEVFAGSSPIRAKEVLKACAGSLPSSKVAPTPVTSVWESLQHLGCQFVDGKYARAGDEPNDTTETIPIECKSRWEPALRARTLKVSFLRLASDREGCSSLAKKRGIAGTDWQETQGTADFSKLSLCSTVFWLGGVSPKPQDPEPPSRQTVIQTKRGRK